MSDDAKAVEVVAIDEVAADIEFLALVVDALERMTATGRKAAMAYLMNRYDR